VVSMKTSRTARSILCSQMADCVILVVSKELDRFFLVLLEVL